jgi:hypothetical protein
MCAESALTPTGFQADLDLMDFDVPMPPAYQINRDFEMAQCQPAILHKPLPMRTTNLLQPTQQQLSMSFEKIQIFAGLLAKLKSSDLDECISCVERVKPLISNKASIAADQLRCAEKVSMEGSADKEVLARQELGRILIDRDLQFYNADLKSFDVIRNYLDKLRAILGSASTEAEYRDRDQLSPRIDVDTSEQRQEGR